ncbi:hypothetical protein B0H63DRAFT_458636 [Podospora didyma]|uniref:Inner kinetochore subunit AME1 domain-containing protein n=1 Tax=Podospora didyma TaxID=330526 RepID=A0AAE0P5E5_9PEZI|nr:hypothetical protein B0H63DRAFT_458636 [Podospora didyma]
MASRQERMQERMRGAGRHQVEEVDFNFIIPVAEDEEQQQPEHYASPSAQPLAATSSAPQDPVPAPVLRPNPNTSAKRKHPLGNVVQTNPTPVVAAPQVLSPPRPPAAASKPTTEVYDIPDYSSTEGTQIQINERLGRGRSSELHHEAPGEGEEEAVQPHHEVEEPSTVRDASSPTQLRSSLRGARNSTVASSPVEGLVADEVGESPVDAPGSGRRRRVRISDAAPAMGSSTLLQRVLDDPDDTTGHEVQASSPLERLAATRRSGEQLRSASAAARTTAAESRKRRSAKGAGSGAAVAGDNDDARRHISPSATEPSLADLGAEDSVVIPIVEERDPEDEVAQEIDDSEAAKRLGRKRPRRSLLAPTSDPDSRPSEEEEQEEPVEPVATKKRRRKQEPDVEKEEEEPVAKRRQRKEPAASPAQQQQPRVRGRKPASAVPEPSEPPPRFKAKQPGPSPTKPTTKNQTKGKRKSKQPSVAGGEADDDEADGGSVPVTVQRFSKAVLDEDEPDAEALNFDIPFAKRGGVNAVDVLSNMCKELADAFIAKLEDRARSAEDAAGRKEQETMRSAIEAVSEELWGKLHEHTIALDNLHALRKRVRVAQKQKLALRDDILRIRAEKDQVLLRQDTIRIRYQAEKKEALLQSSLSSAMHDIDMVVEKGQGAPALSVAEQRRAELANLELLISRIADQACSSSDGGGTLKQIKTFNAFLERAATALEAAGR